jgi:hypothetical protein
MTPGECYRLNYSQDKFIQTKRIHHFDFGRLGFSINEFDTTYIAVEIKSEFDFGLSRVRIDAFRMI